MAKCAAHCSTDILSVCKRALRIIGFVPIHNLTRSVQLFMGTQSTKRREQTDAMNQPAPSTKNYRRNVAAVILSSDYPAICRIFIAERSDIEGAWQFPQGGIDEDETVKGALMRELKEEIGTDEVEIIDEYPEWISYDFPETVAQKMYPYDGQQQRYFLVRLKPGAVISLDTKVPEFSQYRFVDVKELMEVVSHFKRPIYKKVIAHFQKTGYL